MLKPVATRKHAPLGQPGFLGVTAPWIGTARRYRVQSLHLRRERSAGLPPACKPFGFVMPFHRASMCWITCSTRTRAPDITSSL